MKIRITENDHETGALASDLIISQIKTKPDLLFCAATGGSPTNTYRQLAEKKSGYPVDELRVIKLDEWGGIPMQNPGTCESYLKKNILEPLSIPSSNYTGFNSEAKNPEEEVNRIRLWLSNEGPIDICLLGLGMNGHIALNEPADRLEALSHVVKLSEESKNHDMIKIMGKIPDYGLTLGMADILQSKMIIMIIRGAAKSNITKSFLSGQISTNLPASLLWLHPNVQCYINHDVTP